MATKSAESDDPMVLVGVGMDGGPDDQALAEMAQSFVEEFARMGWTGEQILRMFRSPHFRAPHNILRVKGEAFVRDLTETVDKIRSQIQQSDEG